MVQPESYGSNGTERTGNATNNTAENPAYIGERQSYETAASQTADAGKHFESETFESHPFGNESNETQVFVDLSSANESAANEGNRDHNIIAVAGHGVDPAPLNLNPSYSMKTVAERRNPDDYEPLPYSARHARHAKLRMRDDSFDWKDTLVWCAVPVVIVLLLRLFVFGQYSIPSGSMENTIMPGDAVFASQLTPRFGELKRGDIIVFKDPANWLSTEKQGMFGGYLIKRLIGLPGDTVACAGGGAPITINGVAIDESSYIKPGVNPSDFAFEVTVTSGHVFVLGDNRADSADSRFHADDGAHGLVPISDVAAVAGMRYWPLNRISLLDAHHEVFAAVPNRQ